MQEPKNQMLGTMIAPLMRLSFKILGVYFKYLNGSQLAKMKKSIPDMPLP